MEDFVKEKFCLGYRKRLTEAEVWNKVRD